MKKKVKATAYLLLCYGLFLVLMNLYITLPAPISIEVGLLPFSLMLTSFFNGRCVATIVVANKFQLALLVATGTVLPMILKTAKSGVVAVLPNFYLLAYFSLSFLCALVGTDLETAKIQGARDGGKTSSVNLRQPH